MQPLKPYFLGLEKPPHHRADHLPEVLPHRRHRERRHHHAPPDLLRDARQLLDRRLLQAGRRRVSRGSCRSRASASTPSDIWITVFEGDDELGLGPDEEAIAAWEAIGVPRERIVLLPALGELLAGRADRAVRPVQRAVPRPRPGVGRARTTCPAARTSASWSTGTSSSCSTTRTRSATLTPLPAQNIDTGLGLNRMALIQQGVDYDLRDRPVRAADGRSGASWPRREPDERALRILADHSRGDDLPDRRRRRALQRGPRLRPAPAHAPRDRSRATASASSTASCPSTSSVVIETMGAAYPELRARARRRSPSGCAPRRRASAARSSRARGCSTTCWRAGEVSRRGRLPPARHLRLPDRPDARDRRRARRAVRRRRGLRAR